MPELDNPERLTMADMIRAMGGMAHGGDVMRALSLEAAGERVEGLARPRVVVFYHGDEPGGRPGVPVADVFGQGHGRSRGALELL